MEKFVMQKFKEFKLKVINGLSLSPEVYFCVREGSRLIFLPIPMAGEYYQNPETKKKLPLYIQDYWLQTKKVINADRFSLKLFAVVSIADVFYTDYREQYKNTGNLDEKEWEKIGRSQISPLHDISRKEAIAVMTYSKEEIKVREWRYSRLTHQIIFDSDIQPETIGRKVGMDNLYPKRV